jgi:hypothetical protein
LQKNRFKKWHIPCTIKSRIEINHKGGILMKRLSFILLLFGALISTPTFGAPVNFGDNTFYWAGWPSPQGSDNATDEIGVPIFPGTPASPGFSTGSYEIIGGKLKNITFNYKLNGSGFESYIKPADLFIDVGGEGSWDYVVKILGIGSGPGNYALYQISLNSAGGTPGYVLSNTAWAASGVPNPGNYNIRDNHPVGINGSVNKVYEQDVWFNGWALGSGNHTTYFDFGAGLDIVSGIFEFGWTVNCANDVVREQGEGKIPEPTTMVLLGVGLLGLGAKFRRRKK